MGLTPIPGPVRVALAVDVGIAAVYGAAAAVGVPEGPLGNVLVGGQAAVWAAVVLVWVFPAFWARWSATIARLFPLRPHDDAAGPHDTVELAPWPSGRSMVIGAAAFCLLVAAQALTSSGADVAFRSVVGAYVVAGAIGAALLAIVADVTALLAATRVTDE